MNKLINREKTQISRAEEFQVIYVGMLLSLLLRHGQHIVTSFQRVQYRKEEENFTEGKLLKAKCFLSQVIKANSSSNKSC